MAAFVRGAFVRGEEATRRLPAAQAAVEQTLTDEANRITNDGRPAPLQLWLPHLRYLAEDATSRNSDKAGALLNALGRHPRQVADYAGARKAYERALVIFERALGPQHPSTETVQNNLAMLGNEGSSQPAHSTAKKPPRPSLFSRLFRKR